MLVTDPSYRLPLVYALKPGEVLTSGANRPLLFWGYNDQLQTEGDYVLKCIGAEQMSVEAFERELLGCYAAWQVGLSAVEPVEVDVSAEFLALMRGRNEYAMISRSLGRNFGSAYRPGMREFVNNQPLTPAEMEQASLVFAFDVLIQNIDRNNAKQNMLTDGERILLLDHELAFSFTKVLPFLRSAEPFYISEADVEWIQNHYSLPVLEGRELTSLP